jgi:hypothetical protein
MWQDKEYVQNCICKTSWKNAVGRMRRQNGNIKMDLQDVGCENGR